MDFFKCGVCGYIHEGTEAPNKCPKCGAPKEQFTQLNNLDAELITKSRLTNDFHMELRGLLDTIEELAEEGIKEDLDPNCVVIFKRARRDARELAGMIKAEITTHIEKKKWG
ncbi:rubredoxin [Candidatus Woesearchaeota archaeon]|nr:rubredoxin [Candidatus Woesearchaeota archaeon]